MRTAPGQRGKCVSALWLAGLAAGCGGDARVELSAADALGVVAGEMTLAIEEYHREVTRFDASRETAVIAAFVTRVKQDAGDDAALAAHTAQFEAALQKVHADREVEHARRAAATDNVSVLREIASGLQKMAIQSLGLEDELKRYLEGWINAARRARSPELSKAGVAAGGVRAREVSR